MVSGCEIDANSEKIHAIQEMTVPKSIKEVQRLTGRVAALNRSSQGRSKDACLSFRPSSSRKTSVGPLNVSKHSKN